MKITNTLLGFFPINPQSSNYFQKIVQILNIVVNFWCGSSSLIETHLQSNLTDEVTKVFTATNFCNKMSLYSLLEITVRNALHKIP